MIFLNRSRTGADPHLASKIGIFGLGAVLALAGIGLESSWLVGAAILVLLAGPGLRLLQGRGPRPGDEENGEAPPPSDLP